MRPYSDQNYPRATRSSGVHPTCDCQDVSRYKAHSDPAIWGEIGEPVPWRWVAVCVLVIAACSVAALVVL